MQGANAPCVLIPYCVHDLSTAGWGTSLPHTFHARLASLYQWLPHAEGMHLLALPLRNRKQVLKGDAVGAALFLAVRGVRAAAAAWTAVPSTQMQPCFMLQRAASSAARPICGLILFQSGA